jgi:hypothetical protein
VTTTITPNALGGAAIVTVRTFSDRICTLTTETTDGTIIDRRRNRSGNILQNGRAHQITESNMEIGTPVGE